MFTIPCNFPLYILSDLPFDRLYLVSVYRLFPLSRTSLVPLLLYICVPQLHVSMYLTFTNIFNVFVCINFIYCARYLIFSVSNKFCSYLQDIFLRFHVREISSYVKVKVSQMYYVYQHCNLVFCPWANSQKNWTTVSFSLYTVCFRNSCSERSKGLVE